MILVFGGTTEGRKAIEALEEAGNTFYYSTKTGEQDVVLHHGIRVDGAMDVEAMKKFCQEHDIQLMVDAGHPFAEVLHQAVAEVAESMDIPAIRFERIFPARDPAGHDGCAEHRPTEAFGGERREDDVPHSAEGKLGLLGQTSWGYRRPALFL